MTTTTTFADGVRERELADAGIKADVEWRDDGRVAIVLAHPVDADRAIALLAGHSYRAGLDEGISEGFAEGYNSALGDVQSLAKKALGDVQSLVQKAGAA